MKVPGRPGPSRRRPGLIQPASISISSVVGLIATPRDMATCVELPRLVQLMLERGFTPERVRKVLGGNFLRALGALRG